jgi:hypothetical protein
MGALSNPYVLAAILTFVLGREVVVQVKQHVVVPAIHAVVKAESVTHRGLHAVGRGVKHVITLGKK